MLTGEGEEDVIERRLAQGERAHSDIRPGEGDGDRRDVPRTVGSGGQNLLAADLNAIDAGKRDDGRGGDRGVIDPDGDDVGADRTLQLGRGSLGDDPAV